MAHERWDEGVKNVLRREDGGGHSRFTGSCDTVRRWSGAGQRAGVRACVRAGGRALKRHSQHAQHAPNLGAVGAKGVAGVATVNRDQIVGQESAVAFGLGPVGLVDHESRQAPIAALHQNQVVQSDLVLLVTLGVNGHAAVTDSDVVGVPLDALTVGGSLERIPLQVALEPGQAGDARGRPCQ